MVEPSSRQSLRSRQNQAITRWAGKSPVRPIIISLVMTGLGVALVVNPSMWAQPSFSGTTVLVVGWITVVFFGGATAILLLHFAKSRR